MAHNGDIAAPKIALPLAAGDPTFKGGKIVKEGAFFGVYSRHCLMVEVLIYAQRSANSALTNIGRYGLNPSAHHVWHGFLPADKLPNLDGQILSYGYVVHGSFEPQNGHRFDASKLLLDPYATQLCGQFQWVDEHFTHQELGASSNQVALNAAHTLRAVLAPPMKLAASLPLYRPWAQTLIGEVHTKGFTINMDGLSDKERGTFQGLANKKALAYLKSLGITAIELMPISALIDEQRLIRMGLNNYWGYNPISYFALHQPYGSPTDFAHLVARAHDENIEVILDVVYNHTAESNAWGPTLCYRGLDNHDYYRLGEDKTYYADLSGCGASLDASSPVVMDLITDSLGHMVSAYGVDGFRFDLAPHLGTDNNGHFSTDHCALAAINSDARLAKSKLIAEPWDGVGTYGLGQFPFPWSQWSDQGRDSLRRFWRGDQGSGASFAKTMIGSPDLFSSRRNDRFAGVHFVACHDGYTLADLTQYESRHNLANGEENCDGHGHNLSRNYGFEGPCDDGFINEQRDRVARAILASVYLGAGVPMLCVGDEYGRTQLGNNNAYAQDNEISWHNWEKAKGAKEAAQTQFVQQLAQLRTELLVDFGPDFWASDICSNYGQVAQFYSIWGEIMDGPDWDNHANQAFALLLHKPDGGKIWIAFNASGSLIRFRLPNIEAQVFLGVLDSANPARAQKSWQANGGEGVLVPPISLMVMVT